MHEAEICDRPGNGSKADETEAGWLRRIPVKTGSKVALVALDQIDWIDMSRRRKQDLEKALRREF